MGRGALTLFLDTPENREVAGDVAIPFTAADLTRKLQYTLTCSEEDRATLRDAAEQRVRQRYSWDYVTEAYEHLFERLLA
jgi:glycosyltransferase involved in cell wall biosynthesis